MAVDICDLRDLSKAAASMCFDCRIGLVPYAFAITEIIVIDKIGLVTIHDGQAGRSLSSHSP